jgi:hypothetical protein
MATFSELQTGLKILSKHQGNTGNVKARNDRIFVGGPPPSELPDEDAQTMYDLDWVYDNRKECWLLFT